MQEPQEVTWSSCKKFIYSACVNDRRRSYRLQPQEIVICIACVDDRKTSYPVQQQEVYTCTCRARLCRWSELRYRDIARLFIEKTVDNVI